LLFLFVPDTAQMCTWIVSNDELQRFN